MKYLLLFLEKKKKKFQLEKHVISMKTDHFLKKQEPVLTSWTPAA